MRKLALAAAVVALASVAARADEAPPCVAFNVALENGLKQAPDSIQLNNYLFEAARKGCLPALKRLLAAGASRLSRDREGDTALAAAARAGRLPVVAVLIDGAAAAEKAEIDMSDARGSTPLMLAIHFGRANVARALLDAGAKVDPVNAAGETALAEAAFAADDDIGAALLAKVAKPGLLDRYGKSPICYAAARGAVRLVAALLDTGIDVNARYGADLTALMWASGFSDQTPAAQATATVKLLVARGAKLDFVDDRGRSALMIAAALNRFETARALLEAGADRNLRDKGGKSAADLAATPEMRALVKS